VQDLPNTDFETAVQCTWKLLIAYVKINFHPRDVAEMKYDFQDKEQPQLYCLIAFIYVNPISSIVLL